GGTLWLFHSEGCDDDYIIFDDEPMMINEAPDVIGGDEAGSYTSNGIVHINDDGVGYFAATAYFVGADQVPPSSQYSNTHTMIFKKTENFGLTWSGGQEGSPYYFIDDNVFDQMIADGLFPSIYVDECDGSEIIFDGLFLIYDFDLKVDSEGNPHFVAGVIMSGGDGVYPGMPGNAWVHFTIDKDYLLNPGTPNTATGWNYSILMPSHEMWRWDNADGESYWQGTFPSLQFSEENENVMWVVISGPDQGDFVVTDDGGTPEDDCDDLGLFPAWNEEVFILKSVDMGETWWCQYNMTQTIPDCWVDEFGDYQCEDSEICPDGETLIEPDEVNAHAGIGATDDTVPVIYQSPDWCFGSTTGDLSAQNHKTRIFVGTVELTTEDMTECEDEPTPCLLGDVNDDLDIDILDIVSILNNILQGTPLAQPCAADFNEDGAVDILDIVSIVNLILGNRSADATRANIFQTENGVEMTSDGYVGAVQMTLNHNSDFAIELTGDALIADYVTTGNTTTLVVVNPESKGIFTATGEFSIDSAVAANSAAYINVNVADSFALLSNYPNPFNPETVINYEIAVNGSVEIAVFNMVGQKIATLVNENREVGNYSTIWNGMDSNGREVASGVYIVQLKSQNEIVTNKITLLR
nr:T9SS type A sorting domain-containing protein [FCB group bacterium]